jgi:TonB family protein
VRQSDLNAYAWATLAVESGDASAQSLAEQLRPLLAPGSEKMAADIRAPYSRAALDERLMPKVQDTGQDKARCRLVKADELTYPRDAREQGIQGEVTVETTVLADGSTRNPRILSAVPARVFDPTVRAMAMHLRWRPAEAPGAVVHCQMRFRFQMPYGKGAYPDLRSYVADTRKKAEAGNTQAERLYGLLLAGLPQLERPRSEAVPWFLKAAQAGSPVAQYLVGTSLLFGNGCQCEENKGEIWLRKAAQADEPNAQVELAGYALRGAPDARNTKLADVWLERAAASGDHDGTYYLSALLAATPVEELRDSKRALALLEKLREDERDNPTAVEIRAAALADSGAYGDAVKKEHRAISMASSLSWDLAPLNERLARYKAGQPWYGNLLGL